MIFAAKLKVGMSFVITLLTAMKKTLTMMMILMILIMMLMTMTSRRRVMTRTSRSCHECPALVVRKSRFHLFWVGHWNVSCFQASVIAWPVLHNLKGTSIVVLFSCIDYLLLVVAKQSFMLKPRFHAIIDM